jgi:putative tryptophan/tyrosine transport system substrate-binding protein
MMRHRQRTRHRRTPRHKILRRLVLSLAVCFLVTAAESANRVAIISIDQDSTTVRTIKGIRKSIDRFGADVAYMESLLSGDAAADATTLKSLEGFTPDIFVTIGSYATSEITRAFPNRPVVFATVINPQASGFVASMEKPGGRVTGAALDIPADIQFKYFKRVVGTVKRIGVLYSSETENIIRQATVAAKQLGLSLVSFRVDSEKDIPGAIDSLCRTTDVIWSVADQRIYTPQSTKHIILQTLRNQIPMMAFSQALVEAGGLFTLDFDFKDIGRQAGEIAVRVLQGANPGDIPVATPGIIYFKYNEKTAQRINVIIPDDLLAVAKEVIK